MFAELGFPVFGLAARVDRPGIPRGVDEPDDPFHERVVRAGVVDEVGELALCGAPPTILRRLRALWSRLYMAVPRSGPGLVAGVRDNSDLLADEVGHRSTVP